MYPHIYQTGNTSPSTIRVNRRENQMPGQRTAYRHLCRIGIPDLPQHNHIRILPQKSTQSTREGQPDLLFQLNLVHPLQGIFHRVLDRQYITHDIIQQPERGIQRGTLSRSRGTANQNQPVRMTYRRQISLQLSRTKSQVFQIKQLYLPG